MSTTEFTTAPDGTRLLRRTWPMPPHPRAAVQLVHGIAEHSGRFEHVGKSLSACGCAVAALDLRGHGGSGGRRGHVDSWEQLLDDLQEGIEDRRHLGLPVVLYGHSLGGTVALTYVESERPPPDLLILSSPALRATIPPPLRLAAIVLTRLAPRLSLTSSVSAEMLSHDPAVGEAYFADPLVLTKLTARFGGEFLRAMSSARTHLDRLRVPTLVTHGGADPLVPTAGSEVLGDRPGVERVVLEGLRHETHNEDGGAVLLETICAWLDRQLAEPASG